MDAPAADTVIHPLTLMVPFLGGSLSKSTKTLTSVGVVPPAGLTTIQGALLTALHVSGSRDAGEPDLLLEATHARVELGMKQNPMALSLNARADGQAAPRRSLTRIFCGELDAPAAEMVTDPYAGRQGGSLRGSTETVTLVGVVPPAGETTIQSLFFVAVHLSGVPVLVIRIGA